MKKLLAFILTIMIVLSLSACGGKTQPANSPGSTTVADQSVPETNKKSSSENDTVEWRQFLKEYEAWVDEYIEIVKKYKANPTDMSILSDYTNMLSKVSEWSEKADKIQLELKDTDEALKYSEEVLRIAGKLAEINK